VIKKLFAAVIALTVCCSGMALAQDAASIWNWSGFYAGVSGGWGFDPRSDVVFPLAGSPVGKTSGKGGGIVGGTVGINWQHGSLVTGIEGDISWADIKTSGIATVLVPCGGVCGPLVIPPFIPVHCTNPCESTLSGLATVRGRVGFALPSSLLIFGTGGGAFGRFSNSETGFGNASGYRLGWTAGGGIEGMLAPNWTWKAEYLFVNFIHKQIPYNQNSNGLQQNGFQTNIVRIGVNYKFGGDL